MLIYILNFVSIFLYGLLIKNKKLFVALASIQLFLILALRDPLLGVDNAVYMAGYDYISELSFADMLSRLHLIKTADLVYPFAFESGYAVINWIVAALGFNFHGFLILYAAFCTFALGRFVYKYSEDAMLSVIMFVSMGFFIYMFGILRQTIVLALFLLAIPLIKDRKITKFLAVCLIAFTIHRLSIIIVPLYFVYNIKITKKRFVGIGMLLLAFFAVSPLIANYVIKPLLSLFGKSSYDISFNLNSYIFIMVFLALMILLFASFDEQFVNNPDGNFLCWCFVYAILIEIVGLYNDVIARAMFVPYVAVIILIPNILKKYKHTGIAVIGKGLLIVLLFAFMIFTLQGDFVNPYVSCFK